MISLNGRAIIPTMFPDNTSQVWKLEREIYSEVVKEHKYPDFEVKWQFAHEGEFMHLAQLKYLLDEIAPEFDKRLVLSYLPYARQDKEIHNEKTFALRVFGPLLNSLRFRSVSVLDAHSKIPFMLIDGLSVVYPEAEVQNLLHKLPFYPDNGAYMKYRDHYGEGAYGNKTRNPQTGEILEFEICGRLVKGRDVLVIDDICDGGATFVLAAQHLLKAEARSLELFVTHGLFSKGTRHLFEAGYSRIFTAQGEVGPRSRNQENV